MILLTLVTLLSCRELVQDEFPDFTPVPVVNSFLIADSTIVVHVSLAAKMDSIPLKTVDMAEVQLYVCGTFKEILSPRGKGMYQSICTVEPGKSYQCKVYIAGYDTVSCSDSIPLPADILKTESIEFAGKTWEGESYPAVRFTFTNNPHDLRYYEAAVRIYSNGHLNTASLEEITDPVLLSEGLQMAVFSNDQIKDSTYTMLINYKSGYYTDYGNLNPRLFAFVVELRSISYHYYQYLKQLYLYNIGRFPDFIGGMGSVFPLHSNVQNGYGIFAGYSCVVSDLITPE